MSKKNQKETEVKETEVKKLTFEEMKKQVEEFKKLQKMIKALPKEEREKLLPVTHKREIPESLISFSEVVFKELEKVKDKVKELFDNSITTEKPEGNKSISLSVETSNYTIAIIKRNKKEKSQDNE